MPATIIAEASSQKDGAGLKRFHTLRNYAGAAQATRVSREIADFLRMASEHPEDILRRPVLRVAPVDDSHPLTHYFVSTSHNTYLLAGQLVGGASASSYTHVLSNGCRCVEIDVWPSDEGPKVTHGYTLTKRVPFRDVCIAINEAVREDDWPVFVSLECHVHPADQGELVDIMKSVWGSKLLDRAIIEEQTVTPGQLKGRILMMVEYYPVSETEDQRSERDINSEDLANDEDERTHQQRQKISNDLASLGVYARSIKPHKNWLEAPIETLHAMINISEAGLLKLIPHSLEALVQNSRQYLRRVYPAGKRILSGNQDPLACWRAGSHFACLNWQDYDRGMQLNEALFAGTNGWVLKPRSLRGPLESPQAHQRFKLEIIGLSCLPHPSKDSNPKVKVHVELLHSGKDKKWKSSSVRCTGNTEQGFDALFNDTVSWEFTPDELSFIRIYIAESEWGPDDKLVFFCARLDHIQEGWRFVTLMDKQGKGTKATLLVRFQFSVTA